MKHVSIHKAQDIGSSKVESVTITFTEPIPDYQSLPQTAEKFTAEAAELGNVLCATLPGGTYDRLLGIMLAHKASHFIVSHKRSE